MKFRCIYCGRFIGLNELENETAKAYTEPDTEYGPETTEAWHLKCESP